MKDVRYRRAIRARLDQLDLGWIVAALLPAFAILPLLINPGFPNTADGLAHLYRVVDLDQCWRDGVFYPRWAPNLAFGYGTPLFNFAPPLPYYLVQAFHSLGASFQDGFKLLVTAGFLIGALGTYALARDLMGTHPALLAAIVYTYTPYRLREAFIQGNYSQFVALSLLPIILWSFRRLILRANGIYIAISAVAFGALILSHNITTMLFAPILAAYVLFLLWQQREPGRVLAPMASLALALSLTAFFWWPALWERKWIRLEGISQGFFDFRLHFISLGEILAPATPLDTAATNPPFAPSLGLAVSILSIIALAAVLVKSRSSLEQRVELGFFGIALAIYVFLALPLSLSIWENVPFLALAEFPWRSIGIAALGGSVVAGAAALLWTHHGSPRSAAILSGMGCLLVVVASQPYLYPRVPFLDIGDPGPADIVRYELRTQVVGMTSTGEFLPKWVQQNPGTSPLVSDYLESKPIHKLDDSSLPPSASAIQEAHTVISDQYRFTSPESFIARFRTFFYPGWVAYLDGRRVEVGTSEDLGLIEVPVPAGDHRLLVRFEGTDVHRLSSRVSLVALAVLAALMALSLARLRQMDARPSESRSRSLRRSHVLWILLPLGLWLAFRMAYVDSHTTWFRLHSPPDWVLTAQHQMKVDLGGEIDLLGYDLGRERAAQGESIRLRLYWRAKRDLSVDYSSFAHLDAKGVTWAQSNNMNPGDIPTSNWLSSLYVVDDHVIDLPAEILPVHYQLVVGLYSPDGKRLAPTGGLGQGLDQVPLQAIRIESAYIPQPAHVLDHLLGENIRLVGYDLHDPTAEGLPVTLYWQAEGSVEADYVVFIHLLDEEGRIIAQADGAPVQRLHPTSAWTPGEIVMDQHLIPAPAVGGRGSHLAVGMYDLDTLARLSVRGPSGPVPDDRIILPATESPP